MRPSAVATWRPTWITFPSARTSGTLTLKARTMLTFSFSVVKPLPTGSAECRGSQRPGRAMWRTIVPMSMSLVCPSPSVEHA